MEQTQQIEDVDKWKILLRRKLIPSRLVIPLTPGLQEWSRAYRDLLFEMADFIREESAHLGAEVADRFRARSRNSLLRQFTNEEILVLLTKVQAYGLKS